MAKSNEIVVSAFYGSEKANTLLLHTLWQDSLFISLDIHYQILDQFRIDLTAQMYKSFVSLYQCTKYVGQDINSHGPNLSNYHMQSIDCSTKVNTIYDKQDDQYLAYYKNIEIGSHEIHKEIVHKWVL